MLTPPRLALLGLSLPALLFFAAGPLSADEPAPAAGAPATFTAEQVEFFETSVRPVLVAHCQQCHGSRKQEADLRLDTREALLAGGVSGPAVVPGDADGSLLLTALHYRDDGPQMPPKGKLGDETIASLARWIAAGAAWPAADTMPTATAAASDFEIRPQDREFWSFQPVVAYEPPRVNDTSWPQASVDYFILARLEAEGLSPAAPAERRALIRRVTFDLTGLPPTPEEVAEFLADDSAQALATVVERLLNSPHYGERMTRLWLDIARYGEDQAHTFQARKYPQGYRYRDWLIAAFNDDLPYDEFVRQQIAADLLSGPEQREHLPALGFFACGPVYYGDRNQLDQISDRIDTLTRGFLGLTVACARCHDHKYDPISTVDYYALAGVFASTEYVEAPLVSDEEIAAAEQSLSKEEREKKDRPKNYPFAHALQDARQPKNLRVHIRGNSDTLGEEAPRRFLSVLADGPLQPFREGSGRRELADAIASPHNPLTARVLVNRIWRQHFGEGLVRTPSNFGVLGARPTHPELLDYLATRLVASGWSIKALHRELVLSAAYQQSARADAATLEADPENLLWGRMSRRRLEVEPWRDAILAAAGRLDPQIGGPSSDLASAGNRRRTLYGFISRHELNDLLRLFDFPDPNITSDQRPVTTVPLQQLFVLNSEFMANNARALAARLHAERPDDDPARIERAYELLLARAPTSGELSLALAYLSAEDELPAGESARLTRWERYAQALLASNEFLHVE